MADNTPAERVPTVVADGVDIVYRVNGTGAGRGSATAALNRILRREKTEKAAGVRRVHAVKNVSFVAYRGEAIGLIGTNGSGKSTLLKAVAGLLPVENGRIYTDGQPSLLGVNAALMNDLTGERNVYLGGLAMGMSRAEVKERYQEIVDFSGINEKGDFITLPMRTYSSGMAARLRFSIAAAKATTSSSSTRPWPPATAPSRSGPRNASGSCASTPARCSWSATATSPSGTPATGCCGWSAASCAWTDRRRRS
ncbi:Vitamin B12 import ATP-binding protein BtuD [Streptomyces violaceorubidus]